MNIEHLIDQLNKYGQRATYGAVGGLVGLPARSVMHGKPKTIRTSWEVAKKNWKPSGFDIDQQDPRLTLSPAPLSTPEALVSWLKSRQIK